MKKKGVLCIRVNGVSIPVVLLVIASLIPITTTVLIGLLIYFTQS